MLLQALGLNAFSTFDALRQRYWCPGEQADVYLADIRPLARLAGVESDNLVRCSFVCGLPTDVSSQLRVASQIQNELLATVVEQARVLMFERAQPEVMVAMTQSQQNRHENFYYRKHRRQETEKRKMECYECSGDYLVRFCKNRKPVICWRCDDGGHLARNCAMTGNDSGELRAPTIPPHI